MHPNLRLLATIALLLSAEDSQRRFILVGDSGEQDPEIYAKVARKHAGQVAGLFIRNVTGEAGDDPRFTAVREGLGDVRFDLFEEPESLLEGVREIWSSEGQGREPPAGR